MGEIILLGSSKCVESEDEERGYGGGSDLQERAVLGGPGGAVHVEPVPAQAAGQHRQGRAGGRPPARRSGESGEEAEEEREGEQGVPQGRQLLLRRGGVGG